MFLNIFFVHLSTDAPGAATELHGISMPSGLAVAGLIIAGAVTVAWDVVLATDRPSIMRLLSYPPLVFSRAPKSRAML